MIIKLKKSCLLCEYFIEGHYHSSGFFELGTCTNPFYLEIKEPEKTVCKEFKLKENLEEITE